MTASDRTTALEAVADSARDLLARRPGALIALRDAIAALDAAPTDAGDLRMPSPWTSDGCPKVGDIIHLADGSWRIVAQISLSDREDELL